MATVIIVIVPFSLGTNQNISKIMQLLKGESSYWINKNNLCRDKFEWQEHYFATGVSENDLPIIRNYIKEQESHHKMISVGEIKDLKTYGS